uniref:Uncharacterized protein n=1 Tax=Trichinella nativa TaxID=6335 RepID=A0A0V1IM36_9BILA
MRNINCRTKILGTKVEKTWNVARKLKNMENETKH